MDAEKLHDRPPPGQAPRAQTFVFTPVSDLTQEPPEQTSFVWGRILPSAGVSIIGAKPKVGKSTLARGLSNAVASGEDFLGYPTCQGKVLFLGFEEKRAEIAAHFRRMDAHHPNLVIYVGPAPKNSLQALEAAIKKEMPKLVVLDPLSRFFHVADLSDYSQVTRRLEPIIDLARKYGPHIHIPHHNKKGNGDSGEDDLLGSTGLFGGVDTLLIMRRHQGRRTLQSVQRYGEDLRETIIHFDAKTGTLTAGEEMAAVLLSEREDAILHCLSRQSFLSETAIKTEVGGGGGLTSKALRGLVYSGRVQRQGSGKKGDAFIYGVPQENAGLRPTIRPNKPNNPAFPESPNQSDSETPSQSNQVSENPNKKDGFSGYAGIYQNPTTQNPQITKIETDKPGGNGHAGMPFVSVRNRKQAVLDLGYSKAQLDRMRPSEINALTEDQQSFLAELSKDPAGWADFELRVLEGGSMQ